MPRVQTQTGDPWPQWEVLSDTGFLSATECAGTVATPGKHGHSGRAATGIRGSGRVILPGERGFAAAEGYPVPGGHALEQPGTVLSYAQGGLA